MARLTRDERERFDDYAKRGPQELAGMLLEVERSNAKLRRENARLRSQVIRAEIERGEHLK